MTKYRFARVGVGVLALIFSIETHFFACATEDLLKTVRLTVHTACVTDGGIRSAVSGIEITVYQIASATAQDGELIYDKTTEVLEDYEYELCDGVDSDSSEIASEIAGVIANDRVLAEKLYVDSCLSDSDGNAEFCVMPGLYLVVQTNSVNNYQSICPFFVALPMFSEDGTGWNYDVNAFPKLARSDTTGGEKAHSGGGGGSSTDSSASSAVMISGNQADAAENAIESVSTGGTLLGIRLPQTGMRRDLVVLIAAGGILCILFGRRLKQQDQNLTGRKNES
ncbi:MAG: hypothetical protein LUE86_09910 [Clostridiales bacterium]|nr:hypothetical protein [Clostridiales bacterium]